LAKGRGILSIRRGEKKGGKGSTDLKRTPSTTDGGRWFKKSDKGRKNGPEMLSGVQKERRESLRYRLHSLKKTPQHTRRRLRNG